MPLDEAKLAKAMYIEYYLPPDPPGQRTQVARVRQASATGGRRVGQDVRFDNDGNVWLTDRGYPASAGQAGSAHGRAEGLGCCPIRRTASTKCSSIDPA